MDVGIDACVVANVRVVLATAVASRTRVELHVSPFARGDILACCAYIEQSVQQEKGCVA